jgi:hypothetical protein
MAQMVPERPPEKASAGEKRLFAALQKLDDSCIVYYEPVVENRRPDFIVIMPGVGVLVIEVKGWPLGSIVRADHQQVTIQQFGKEVRLPHPAGQAREYMFRLVDECRRLPQASELMHTEGKHTNPFLFPFAHIAVLSQIKRCRLTSEAPEAALVFPPARNVTIDELESWETLGPADLKARLKSFFDPWWPFAPLTASQADILRALIHPEIVISTAGRDLKTLDLRQERHARAIGDGHRIVYGVAGSGKTVILIARAKLIAEDSEKQVLLLCRNIPLRTYFRTAFRDRQNVLVHTFQGWGVRNGAAFKKEQPDEEFGSELLNCLQNGGRDKGGFDAVLIDEAQDIPCLWFQCAKLALKEPETGDLLIVGDGNQALYRSRPFSWAEAGIHARGRTIQKRFDLDRNYRNTAQILRAAHGFAAKPSDGENAETKAVLTLPVTIESAVREGPEPVILTLAGRVQEVDYSAALIETWMLGGIEVHGRRVPVSPNDIAILYPRIPLSHEPAMERLRERLSCFTRPVMLSGARADGTLDDDGVKILTMQGARGLQFRCVILLWADLLPKSFEENDAVSRSLFYVALTRAEDVLVILHSGSSPYVDEVRRNMERAAMGN